MQIFPVFVPHHVADMDAFLSIAKLIKRFGIPWLSNAFDVIPQRAGQRLDTLPPNAPDGAKIAHVDNGGKWDPENLDFDHHGLGHSAASMIYKLEKHRYEGHELELMKRLAEIADRLDAHVPTKNDKAADAFRQLRAAIKKVNDHFGTSFILTNGDYYPTSLTSPLFSLHAMVDLGEINEYDKIRICLTLLQAWWVKKLGEMNSYQTVPGYIPPKQMEPDGELYKIIDEFLYEASGFSGELPTIAHNRVLTDLKEFNEGVGLPTMNASALAQIRKLGKIVEETNQELETGFQITHLQKGPWELTYWYETLGELVRSKAISPSKRSKIMRQLVRAYYLDEVISRDIIKAYKQIEEDPEKVFYVGEHKVAVFENVKWWPKRFRHAVARRLSWAGLSMFVTQHSHVLAVTSVRRDGTQISLKPLHERLHAHAPDLGPEELFIHNPGEFVIYNYHEDRISLETTLEELENTFGKKTSQPFRVAV